MCNLLYKHVFEYYLRIHVYLQEVEDYDNYVYNLTESNQSLNSKPNWFKLYSFKDAYNVQSLSLKNIGLLVKRIAKDDQLFNHYYL